MTLLQSGFPKSGNFWLYQILQQVLSRSGNPSKSFIEQHPIQELAKNWELNYPGQSKIDVLEITDLQVSYRISSIFQMPVENLEEYLEKTNHVWTHSPICKRSHETFSFFNKKVYIIRDPRDMLISASKYYCSEYMLKYFPQEETDPERFLQKNFDRLLFDWVWHVWDHLRLRKDLDIHICFFEGFLLDFQREISLLLKYLGIDLNQSEKQDLEKAVSFQTMKKKNPKHLKKGAAGYWMDQLSPPQIAKAEIIAGPLLEFLKYPKKGEGMKFSRNFSTTDFEKLKEQIIESQEPLYR